jgi:3-methylcrotonyl-CoA carboxylase beta subunit
MPQLASRVDRRSEAFRANDTAQRALATELRLRLTRVAAGGSEAARDTHVARGKLLPRDRVDTVLDRGSPFLEIGALAAWDMYDDETPSAGVVAGIGLVARRPVMVVANDATVKGGSYTPMTVKKHLRAQEIAAENRLPCVYLVDSGGAYLPLQADVFPDRDHFGRIFYNQARMSAAGIAQISAVLGSSTAGGAYVPAMSDETVIVAQQGTIFLGGPPLVRAATGEVVSAEDLGGGAVHARASGVAGHLAADDRHALQIVRSIVETLPPPAAPAWERRSTEPPAVPEDELYGAVPVSLTVPADPREVIARLVDGSRFAEFKSEYGTTLVTGFARPSGSTRRARGSAWAARPAGCVGLGRATSCTSRWPGSPSRSPRRLRGAAPVPPLPTTRSSAPPCRAVSSPSSPSRESRWLRASPSSSSRR